MCDNKPVKRERTVTYWDCGVCPNGHSLQAHAASCMRRNARRITRATLAQDIVDHLASNPIASMVTVEIAANLSVRTRNVLKNWGRDRGCDITVGELAASKESDLLKVQNCGRKSLNEIQAWLKAIAEGAEP